MKLILIFLALINSGLAMDLPIKTNGSNPYATEDLLSRRGELNPPPSMLEVEDVDRVLFSDIKEQNTTLKKVKYYLINGNTRLARAYLSKMTYTTTKQSPVVYRYQGVMAFIEGDFLKSYQWLSKPELQNIPHFSKICTLKILNQIVLNKTQDMEREWTKCKIENPRNFNENNLVWLETLVQLKLNPKPGITKAPFEKFHIPSMGNNDLKVFLKLALYLNQEEMVVPQISSLGEDQLQDPEVRELVGQLLFRTGSLAKSYKFIEDLKSPNAENIKGNIYLLRKKYELAYSQFKVALEQKQNSQNALERLMPLAWVLEDWEEGSKYAERVIASPEIQINKLTIMAAFLTQKKDYKEATKVLESISQHAGKSSELDVTQIYTYVALMQNRPGLATKEADKGCLQKDLTSCWISLQLGQWENFPITMLRPEKIVVKNELDILTKETFNDPINETVFVNQLDIEEMDDQLIRLIKAP